MNCKMIKAILGAKGLRQKSVASALKISDRTLNNYLSGKSNLNSEDFCKLLKHIGLDIDSELNSVLLAASSSTLEKKTLRIKLMEEQKLKLTRWFTVEKNGGAS